MLTGAKQNVPSVAAYAALNEDTGGCLDTHTQAQISDSSEEQR